MKWEQEAYLRRPIVLRTTYSKPQNRTDENAADSWKSHGHVTTQPMAIPDAEISAVRFSLSVVSSVIYVNYNYNENSKITWKKLAVNDNYNYNEIIANNYN